MKNPPERATKRTLLVALSRDHAELIHQYYLNNRKHLEASAPRRAEEFYTLPYWQEALALDIKVPDSVIKLVAFNKERTKIIGLCDFTNIIFGAFQACHLGYSVTSQYEGQGYATEIIEAGIDYIFNVVGLHRVMANYLPNNKRSGALLERLGFEREGIAKSYLKINGSWEDHILTSKINNS